VHKENILAGEAVVQPNGDRKIGHVLCNLRQQQVVFSASLVLDDEALQKVLRVDAKEFHLGGLSDRDRNQWLFDGHGCPGVRLRQAQLTQQIVLDLLGRGGSGGGGGLGISCHDNSFNVWIGGGLFLFGHGRLTVGCGDGK
jgi:hypothetical protein